MKNTRVTISVLAENTAQGMGLLGEHGLSLWIETPETCVLFDAGQGLALPHNAEALNTLVRLQLKSREDHNLRLLREWTYDFDKIAVVVVRYRQDLDSILDGLIDQALRVGCRVGIGGLASIGSIVIRVYL